MKTRILGIGELSKATNISISTLTRWRYDKQITPTICLGGRYFYSEETAEQAKKLYYGGKKAPAKAE